MASAPPLLEALRGTTGIVAAELRPPLAELATADGMEAWIDTYHAVRRLTRSGTYVFLTDSAVGTSEEDNLRHLIANVGTDVARERIVPFLTAKHTRHYCESYAERAAQHGFPALVVLGGDRASACPAASSTRGSCGRSSAAGCRSCAGRLGQPERRRGGAGRLPARPHLPRPSSTSRRSCRTMPCAGGAVPRELQRAGVDAAGHVRRVLLPQRQPAHARDARAVPARAGRGAARRVRAGRQPQEVCARTLRALRALGARHFYISNLPLARADRILAEILELAGVASSNLPA
jgi:hypothetical protein